MIGAEPRMAGGARGDRTPALPPHVRVVRECEGLSAIHRRGVNLALWVRRVHDPVAPGLADLARAGIPPFRLTGEPSRIAAALGAHLPDHPARSWLIEDAAHLAGALGRLVRAPQVTLRLETIAGEACRFFHADRVTLRLVTTYHGRGTQWLADDDADILAPGRLPPEDRTREMAVGHVAVFRGSGADGTRRRPLVHRSPPPRPGDAPRLFLAIDPAPTGA